MSNWRNFQAPVCYFPKLENGTSILTYHCDNCGGPILATSPSHHDEFLITIDHYRYCPFCGSKMEYLQLRDKLIPVLEENNPHASLYFEDYGERYE